MEDNQITDNDKEDDKQDRIELVQRAVEGDKEAYQLKQTEGYSSANWILLDYGDIVIHLFDEENRLFYDLERIWRDGKVMDAKELKEEQ